MVHVRRTRAPWTALAIAGFAIAGFSAPAYAERTAAPDSVVQTTQSASWDGPTPTPTSDPPTTTSPPDPAPTPTRHPTTSSSRPHTTQPPVSTSSPGHARGHKKAHPQSHELTQEGAATSTPAPSPTQAPLPIQEGPPANGSQPRLQLPPAQQPVAQPAAVVTVTRNPFSWLMPQPEMGVRIFAAGLVGLIISIAGLVTVAVRRRRW
jgi:hypothetical protein